MKIMIVQIIGSYIDEDVSHFLNKAGHTTEFLDLKKLRGDDLYINDALEQALEKGVRKDRCDGVYSANFFPLLAKRCHEEGLPYMAWHYDTPPHLPTLEHMDYPTNHIFFFNKKDHEFYEGKGIEATRYLPLAVNTKRLKGAAVSDKNYETDASLVGQLYQSTLPAIKSVMKENDKGWLEGLVSVQRMLYGSFILPDILSDERLASMNEELLSSKMLTKAMDVRQLSYSVATYITYLDRVALLSMFSQRFKTELYAERLDETERGLLSKVRYRGSVDYMTVMPKVFYNSRINLCPILRNNVSAIPLRALDVMGCGGFLMANYQEGLAEAFESGRELVMYASIEQAVELAQYYLSHEDERKKVAAAGLERMEKDFTYESRIDEMLKVSFR